MQKKFYIILSWLVWIFVSSIQAQGNVSRYAANSVLSKGKWVKIRVSEAGMYQLTTTRLRSMGFSNPDKVKLYGLNLEMLPETSIEDIADDLQELPLLRTANKLLFYGRGTTKWTLSSSSSSRCLYTHSNNPYSQYTYYFLTEAEDTDSLPSELPTYSYTVGSAAIEQTTFPEHSLIEEDAYSFLHSGRTFYENYDYQNGATRDYSLALPGLVSGTTTRIAVQFCAAGSSSSSLNVSVNGIQETTLSFSKLGSYEYGKQSSRVFSPDSVSVSNTITLTHSRASGISGHLDYICASYLRYLNLSGLNQLLFRPYSSGQCIFHISGASAESVVLHVNDVSSWEEVAGSFDATTSTLSVPFETSSNYRTKEELIVFNPSANFPEPTFVQNIENQNLHALDSLDLVIVVPASGKLVDQAQRLANLHTEVDSMRCAVVRADQVYNEFSSGTPDATAIRRFMKMLWDKASSTAQQPRNLLLFGDGVWDNRMVTSSLRGKNPDDYLLCYESDNSLSHTNSYVLEDYYVLLDDDGGSDVLSEYPRIGVGRIPVTTVTEARDVVNKLETYIRNKQTGAWKNIICMLADDGNDNIHMQDAEAVISNITSRFPDYHIKRIYWDTYERTQGSTGNGYPAAETDIAKQMQDGALIMNYTGHGAAYMMSHEKVLELADFANWNSPRLPLWITAACDVSPFDMEEENIGETALLNPDGAAMGIVTTARTVYSSPNRTLNMKFMQYVLGNDALGRRITLGEALSLAKGDCIHLNSSSVNKAHFVLLGDPAIHLQTPTYKIAVDKLNSCDATSDSLETVAAGSVVTVSGHIIDEDGNIATNYHGRIEPTVYDNEEQVTCLNNSLNESNGNTSTTPYQFYDRVRTLYQCIDSVEAGQFQFSFPIPLDNNYSGKTGLINLYAANTEHTTEAHGRFERFLISGTSDTLSTDTTGPIITFYLNTSDFQPGDVVNETPQLFASFTDTDGINMTGSGIGHDLSLIIDNKESTTYSLNSYFTPTLGDYRSGTITFSIPELEEGEHSLTIRAFDILNNASQVSAPFYVNVGLRPTIYELQVDCTADDQTIFIIKNDRPNATLQVEIQVFDVTGRRVWKHQETDTSGNTYRLTWNHATTDSYLPNGVYIVKAAISTSNGPQATESRKFVIIHK